VVPGRSGGRVDEQELHVERVAALDLGKAALEACVRVPHQTKPGRRLQEVRGYGTTTAALLGLADWLHSWGVTRVVMESTSASWKGVYWLLQAEGLSVQLVNAQEVKNVPGRPKTDKADAVWLAKVAERGRCRPSLVHPRPIRQLRDLTRYRRSLIQDRTRELQRVEQAAGRRPDQAQLGRHRHLRGLGAGDAGGAGGRPA
jgi:transposase